MHCFRTLFLDYKNGALPSYFDPFCFFALNKALKFSKNYNQAQEQELKLLGKTLILISFFLSNLVQIASK